MKFILIVVFLVVFNCAMSESKKTLGGMKTVDDMDQVLDLLEKHIHKLNLT